MSLQSRVSGRLAQLRAAGQLLGTPRPPAGPSAGAPLPRARARAPGPRARPPAGLGARGVAAVGQSAGVRTWGPLAMAAKVDLTTSTDWKEAKSFLKGLSDKQREEHYFCQDFIRLKKIPTWKEAAKGTVKVEEPKYKKDKQLNDKISLFRGDITKLEVDAIVNAANSSLLGGGGVDGCIHRAAGPLLTEECRTLQSCETGEAKITCGYRLPAKYVIHTVGPIAHGAPSDSQAAELRSCYLRSLDLLLEHRLRSAAFPCISTGVFGYPNEEAADVVLSTLREWLEQHKDKVDRLIICVFLEKDQSIYQQKLPHYFPVA
ncbi:ADP-ribose glycohydrolase MACROD1 isoform X2 [Sorex araneus]|uniref:ADP-ribose glycohydrolase MACROD1 isoform X2 n=1 Tax=Sorex araneus TaxID=42254 RepID=UPI00243409B3|nr:ADP-ribose glycohydrolase MACROD1 isoform X2 [Sorex araneus]XP_054999105.1 ADP-ribose glycohydrolase MACROD1 isoform X2 [Sorex araneus]